MAYMLNDALRDEGVEMTIHFSHLLIAWEVRLKNSFGELLGYKAFPDAARVDVQVRLWAWEILKMNNPNLLKR